MSNRLFTTNSWQNLQKKLSGLLIFALLLPSLLIPAAILVVPQKAQALVPIVKPPIACAILDIECIKEYTLDILVATARNAALQTITRSIVSWIQGGGGNFIQNLEQELGRQLDLQLGEFLNKLAGINLCGNIGFYLNLNFRSPLLSSNRNFQQQLQCSLSDIVGNVQNFFSNFYDGGWPAFIRISLIPSQNYYGAYLITHDLKLDQELSLVNSIQKNFLAGKVFLGIQDCQQVPDGDYNLETGEPTYYTQCRTTTPGATVARALEKAAVDTPLEQIVNSHEIEEMVNAKLNALIKKVMTGIF